LGQPDGGGLRGAAAHAFDFRHGAREIAGFELRFAAREAGQRPLTLGIGADGANRHRLREPVDQALGPALIGAHRIRGRFGIGRFGDLLGGEAGL
jgi:hypothetical protein